METIEQDPEPVYITRKCIKCSSEFLPGRSQQFGMCDQCAIKQGVLVPEAGEPWREGSISDLPRSFGDYELKSEIARGGMGVVYKARQKSLNRTVAIKLLLAGSRANGDYIARFRSEASAAASLQHPHIISIHEVGIHDNEHFISMDYVDGPSFASLLKEGPLPSQRAARYLKTIAEAVHYAHENGILHRDLKPSNVLLDSSDRPRVTDFGLAKRFDCESDFVDDALALTASGHLVGSPGYMPPEQAAGDRHKISRRSDVYSLGATLYHLLTGRPPFGGGSLAKTIEQVINEDPISLRLLNPEVPLDLETICLKCLEKDSNKRYATAQEVALELERFLNHEPIRARPIGRIGRACRWARKKPIVAALLVALIITISVGVTAVVFQYKRAEAHAKAESSQKLAVIAAGVRLDLEVAERFFSDYDSHFGLAHLARALRGSPTNTAIAARLMGALSQRQFFTPVGTPWRHQFRIDSARFSSDGTRVLVVTTNDACIWDAQTGHELAPSFLHYGSAAVNKFNDEGNWFISFPKWPSNGVTFAVWKCGDLGSIPTKREVTNALIISGAEFIPNTDLVAIGYSNQKAAVFRLSDLRKLREFAYDGQLENLTFNAQGIVTTSNREPTSFARSNFLAQVNGSRRLSPDGNRLVLRQPEKNQTLLYDLKLDEPIAVGIAHRGYPTAVVFTPTSDRIAVAAENVVSFYDSKSGLRGWDPILHPGRVSHIAFAPDGKRLVTTCEDRAVRIWNTPDRKLAWRPIRSSTDSLQFSSDGTRLITRQGALMAIDPNTSRELNSVPWPFEDDVSMVRLSEDGRMILVWYPRGWFEIRDAFTFERITPRVKEDILLGSFNSSGTVVSTFSPISGLSKWEVATGKWLLRNARPWGDFRFGPFSYLSLDSKIVVGLHESLSELQIWDATKLRLIGKPIRTGDRITRIHVSKSRRLVATASSTTVWVWDFESSKLSYGPFEHGSHIDNMQFSPDDGYLLTIGQDRILRSWRLNPESPVRETMQLPDALTDLQFSPEGTLFVTFSPGGTRVWDWATGRPVSETMQSAGGPVTGSFSSTSRQLLINCSRDAHIVLDLYYPPVPPPKWLPTLAEYVAGVSLDESGSYKFVPQHEMRSLLDDINSGPHLRFTPLG